MPIKPNKGKVIVLNANNVESSVDEILESVADEYIAQNGSSEQTVEDLKDTSNETVEEKSEKLNILDKLRGLVSKLSQKKFKPKRFSIGLLYRASDIDYEAQSAMRKIVTGIGDAFNITIDIITVSVQLVVSLLSYLIQNLVTYTLEFVRSVVNKLMKVEGIA